MSSGPLVQLARASACPAECYRFESDTGRQSILLKT